MGTKAGRRLLVSQNAGCWKKHEWKKGSGRYGDWFKHPPDRNPKGNRQRDRHRLGKVIVLHPEVTQQGQQGAQKEEAIFEGCRVHASARRLSRFDDQRCQDVVDNTVIQSLVLNVGVVTHHENEALTTEVPLTPDRPVLHKPAHNPVKLT